MIQVLFYNTVFKFECFNNMVIIVVFVCARFICHLGMSGTCHVQKG